MFTQVQQPLTLAVQWLAARNSADDIAWPAWRRLCDDCAVWDREAARIVDTLEHEALADSGGAREGDFVSYWATHLALPHQQAMGLIAYLFGMARNAGGGRPGADPMLAAVYRHCHPKGDVTHSWQHDCHWRTELATPVLRAEAAPFARASLQQLRVSLAQLRTLLRPHWHDARPLP